MVVVPLHLEVWAVFSVSPSSMIKLSPSLFLGELLLLFKVDTLPPDLIRRLFPSGAMKFVFVPLGGGTMVLMIYCMLSVGIPVVAMISLLRRFEQVVVMIEREKEQRDNTLVRCAHGSKAKGHLKKTKRDQAT